MDKQGNDKGGTPYKESSYYTLNKSVKHGRETGKASTSIFFFTNFIAFSTPKKSTKLRRFDAFFDIEISSSKKRLTSTQNS